jgi:hypothetical protein
VARIEMQNIKSIQRYRDQFYDLKNFDNKMAKKLALSI